MDVFVWYDVLLTYAIVEECRNYTSSYPSHGLDIVKCNEVLCLYYSIELSYYFKQNAHYDCDCVL